MSEQTPSPEDLVFGGADPQAASAAPTAPTAPSAPTAPTAEDTTQPRPTGHPKNRAHDHAQRAAATDAHGGVRIGTLVWGLVVLAVGVLVLAVSGGAHVDGGAVAIGLLGGAGLVLVLGSAVAGSRRRHRERRAEL